MIKNEINSSIAVLDDKKNQLVSYLKKQMGTIVLPEINLTESTKNTIQTKNKNAMPILFLVVGAVALIVGLCINNPPISIIVSVLGILALVGGVVFIIKKRRSIFNPLIENGIMEPDFSRLTNNIYKTLESAQSHIKKEWDFYLGKQNDILKSKIHSIEIESDQRTEMLDKLSQRSQIKFSMMDAYSELNSVSKMKDLVSLKNTMDELTNKLAAAIEIAYSEQCAVYNSLD